MERMLDRLISVAADHGLTIYNICFRVAGVAIMWCDQEKLLQVGPKNHELALFVDHYYPTLRQAIKAELKRLEKKNLVNS